MSSKDTRRPGSPAKGGNTRHEQEEPRKSAETQCPKPRETDSTVPGGEVGRRVGRLFDVLGHVVAHHKLRATSAQYTLE